MVNTELHELVKLFFGNVEPSSPQMKLCTVPESTKLIFDASGAKFKYPVVSVKNVFVLPGIPQLFERVIPSLVSSWAANGRNRDNNFYFYLYCIT